MRLQYRVTTFLTATAFVTACALSFLVVNSTLRVVFLTAIGGAAMVVASLTRRSIFLLLFAGLLLAAVSQLKDLQTAFELAGFLSALIAGAWFSRQIINSAPNSALTLTFLSISCATTLIVFGLNGAPLSPHISGGVTTSRTAFGYFAVACLIVATAIPTRNLMIKAATLLLAAGVAASNTRGAWIVLLVLLLQMVAIHGTVRSKMTMAAVGLTLLAFSSPILFERLQASTLGSGDSIAFRLRSMAFGLTHFNDLPLLGLGTLDQSIVSVRIWTATWFGVSGPTLAIDSMLLSYALFLGKVGVILSWAVLLTLVVFSLRNIRSRASIAAVGLLVWFVLDNLSSAPALLFAGMMAGVMVDVVRPGLPIHAAKVAQSRSSLAPGPRPFPTPSSSNAVANFPGRPV